MRRIYLFIITAFLLLGGLRAAAMGDAAEAACLINAVTGETVFEKNADAGLPMASTTKIMTLLVAIENSDKDDVVTITREAVLEEGSSAYLEEGAKMRMEELWYGLMLNSGNDAAVAIACHISGSREKFAELMNDTAARIGLRNTSFKNPNGLDAEGHYTTARDLANLTRFALNNERFREVVAARTHTAEFTHADGGAGRIEYINHNRLLKELDGCIGVKTGYTKADGRCLVSAAQRDGMRFIAVTLNDPDDWAEHKEMIEAGFSGAHIVKAVKKGDCIRHVVRGGKEICKLVAAEDFDIPSSSEKASLFELRTEVPQEISGPLNKDEKIGELKVAKGDEIIGTVNVIADRDVAEAESVRVKHCFLFYILTILRNLFR